MIKENLCILENEKLFRKFCQCMDKRYECKSAFGCSTDKYTECISCPLARAFMVMHLMRLKNLPLGEAFRLCERKETATLNIREILKQLTQPLVYSQQCNPTKT